MLYKRKEMLEKLRTCRPGVEKNKVSVEGTDCFLFKKGRIYTYNGYVSVSVPSEYEFECAIPADEFYKILAAFRATDVDIEIKDTCLHLRCGKASADVNFMSEAIYKQILSIAPPEDMKWQKIPDGFLDGLKRTFIRNMNASTSEKIDGIYIDTNGIFSTDSVVVNYYKLYDHIMDKMWLTSKMVKELLRFDVLDGYYLQDNWAVFKSGEVMFHCRKYIDSYPINKIRSVISSHSTDKMYGTLNKEFVSAVTNCVIFGKEIEDRSFINLEFQKDGIQVFSTSHKGSYSEFVECGVEDWDHITLCIDGNKLLNALEKEFDIPFYIGYNEGKARAFILHKDNWTELLFSYVE